MINQENWYKFFFNGLALEMWNHALPQTFTDGEIKFIKEISSLTSAAAVLDVPCGSGRLSIPLAKEGFRLTSIDISQGNINVLRQHAHGLDISMVCADILEHPIEDRFDLAICMGNSFSYFPYGGMLLFASKVKQVLKPGARFIINSGAIAESLLPNLKERMEMSVGDLLFKIENFYEVNGSVLRTVMQFIKDDVTETKTSYHFIYTLAEIRRMLQAAGFTTFEVYEDVNKGEYKLGSHQGYLVVS